MREAIITLAATLTLALALALGGCVLPADEPTGLELSWRLIETNTVDGEDAQRQRSCDGGLVEEVVFWITDTSDASRSEIFRYDCDDGYQTFAQFQTDSSDAFVELKPRKYQVIVDIVSVRPDGEEDLRRARNLSVDVLERTLTRQDFDFGLEPAALELSIVGEDACDQVSFSLRYADVERDLADPPRNDAGDIVADLPYREGLVSDQDLRLDGEVVSCADTLGTHRFTEVDPGRYLLLLDKDGAQCAVDLSVGPGGEADVIDLANLPCDG